MDPVPFIAESAAEALAQIRATLGPDAVVVNVRPLPRDGLHRLWQKARIEVLATVPTPADTSPAGQPRIAEHIRAYEDSAGQSRTWGIGPVLEEMGMLPIYAQQVTERLQFWYGEKPLESLHDELVLARTVLAGLWVTGEPIDFSRPQVFIGPHGAGKSTALCKWLTQFVLLEGRTARAWRLDGGRANTAEMLAIHCDILGVPLERRWNPAPGEEALHLIDLPGVAAGNPSEMNDLAARLKQLPSPQVHLTLNAAYETRHLLAQARAFASLPVTDLVLTHLDEETRWGKLWNLVLGTNYTLRFLGAGQNIPGEFHEAAPEKILSRQFPLKPA